MMSPCPACTTGHPYYVHVQGEHKGKCTTCHDRRIVSAPVPSARSDRAHATLVVSQCGTCKHRSAPDPGERYAKCKKVLHGNNAGSDDFYEFAEDGLKAVVLDGDGRYAELHVRDDFGCVLWEAT